MEAWVAGLVVGRVSTAYFCAADADAWTSIKASSVLISGVLSWADDVV